MLASLLPGIRHLRAPLAAGYLWLVIAWILLYDRWDSQTERGASLEALLALRDEASTAGFAIAISFVAYVIGSLSQSLTSGLAERGFFALRRSIRTRGTGLSPQAFEQLVSLVRRELRSADETLKSKGFDHPSDRALWARENEAHFFVNEAEAFEPRKMLIPELEDRKARFVKELVRDDLPLVHLRLAGAEATRELFAEIDRTRSEAELRLAIWFPIAVLILVFAEREWGELGLAISAVPAIGIGYGLAIQGIQRRQAANDSLVDVVRSRVAQLPTFELLREQAAAANAARDS